MKLTLIAQTIASAFLLGTPLYGLAQVTTLQASFEAARNYDAAFSSAKANLQAAQERAIQARAGLLPTVNLTGTASDNHIELSVPSVHRTYQTAGVTLAANYPLYRPANTEAFNQAKANVKIAEASMASAKQDLITRLAQAYFDVLLAQDTLVTIGAQKAAIGEQLAQAKREFEVGTKTILDTNEAQARFDQTLAQEAVATGDLSIKKAALELITGEKASQFARPSSKPTIANPQPADVDVWANRALEAAFPVQIAEISRQIAKLEYNKAKSGDGPTLDLTANVNVTRNIGSATSAAKSTTQAGGLGVAFSYPVYSGGSLSSKVREAAANLEKSQFDLESSKRAAAQLARQAYFGLSYGVTQIAALESAEKSSLTLLDSTKLGYQVGVRINLDVLNAQQNLAATRKDLAKARYDALIAGLRLKAAASQLTDDDILQLSAQLTGTPVQN